MTAEATVAVEVSFLTFADWILAEFDPATPAEDQLPTADPERDGRPNDAEFFTGTDPTVPDVAAVDFEITPEALTATFPRSKHIDPSTGRARWSADLESWSTEGVTVETAGELTSATELIRASVPISLGIDGHLFLGFEVLLPEDEAEARGGGE
jgi:hypothetical protein